MQKHNLKDKKPKQKDKPKNFNIKQIASKFGEKTIVQNTKNRKTSSTQWLQRQMNDPFVKAANEEGYLSRAIFKIMEIDQKFSIFKENQIVVDLGCAPGSWMQYIWNKIRSKNTKLIGIDLLDTEYQNIIHDDRLKDNVKFIKGDFTDESMREKILEETNGKKIDIICSDIAPNTIGIKKVDHLAIMSIIELVEQFAQENLKTNGHLIMKLFQGEEQNELIKRLKQQFKKINFFKPISSRKSSKEIFVVCLNKKSNIAS